MQQTVKARRSLVLPIVLPMLALIGAWTVPTAAFAQENDLLAYLPMAIGDFWTFEGQLPTGPTGPAEPTETAEADGAEEAKLAFFMSSEEVSHSGRAVVRRDQSDGKFRLQALDQDGLWLESVHFLGDIVVQYREPALILPTNLSVGGQHHTEVRYRTVTLDLETDQGIQTFDVSRLANASVTTLAGTFDDCLTTRTQTLRTGEDGASQGSDLTEWRAPGVGLVKVKGEFYRNDSNGQRTGSSLIDAVLSGASVGGQPIEDSGH